MLGSSFSAGDCCFCGGVSRSSGPSVVESSVKKRNGGGEGSAGGRSSSEGGCFLLLPSDKGSGDVGGSAVTESPR